IPAGDHRIGANRTRGVGSEKGELWDVKGCDMRVRASATICSAVLLCVVAQGAAAVAPDEASLQKALDRLVAAGVPGAVLLVRDRDRTIRLASGYSVLAGRVRARPGDRFRIGSVTKTFVS